MDLSFKVPVSRSSNYLNLFKVKKGFRLKRTFDLNYTNQT